MGIEGKEGPMKRTFLVVGTKQELEPLRAQKTQIEEQLSLDTAGFEVVFCELGGGESLVTELVIAPTTHSLMEGDRVAVLDCMEIEKIDPSEWDRNNWRALGLALLHLAHDGQGWKATQIPGAPQAS